jgi:hypothetical protein
MYLYYKLEHGPANRLGKLGDEGLAIGLDGIGKRPTLLPVSPPISYYSYQQFPTSHLPL